MSSTASQTSVTHPTGRRIVLTVAVLVLTGLLAVGFGADITAAADHELERNGTDLVVNVSDVDDPAEVIVTVTEPSDPEIVYNESEIVDGEARIDVRDAENVTDADLTDATVTVEVEQATDGNETDSTELATNVSVPLHTVAIANDEPAWIDTSEDDPDRFRIPLDEAGTTGLSAGATVPIDLDGNGTADASATITDGGGQLQVDRDAVLANAPPGERLGFEVRSDAGPVTDELLIEPELRSTHDGLAVWHPLFDADESYAVIANVAGSDDEYTATAAETMDEYPGFIRLSGTQRGDIELRVTDAEDGTILVNATHDDSLKYEGPQELNLTVINESTLGFGPSLAGLAIDGALAGSGDDVQYVAIDDSVGDDGQLLFDESTLDALEMSDGDTLILSTAAGEIAVTLQSDDAAAADDGSFVDTILPLIPAFLIPLVVGMVPGAVLGKRSEETPDLVQTGLISVIGFSLASLGVVVILWVLLSDLRPMETVHFVGLGGVLVGTIIGGITHQWFGSQGATTGDTPFAAKVTVTDGANRFSGDVAVHYRKADGREQGPETVRGGRKRIQMPGSGTWELYARHGAARSAVKSVDASDPSVTLTIPVETTLTVVDAIDGDPLPDVTARTEGEVVGTTDRNGAITIEPPEGGGDIDIELSHDRYAVATQRVRFRQDERPTVRLDRRNGQLRGTSRIDGEPGGPVPLRIVPDDEFLRDRFDAKTLTTAANGALSEQEVPVGQYRVESALADNTGVFAGRETVVQVRESGTATAEVDVQFTWQLGPRQRDRIDRIRSDARSIADSGGRDGAIPQYYVSVIDAILDTAESIPNAGHEFVNRDIRPDATVEALLEAAERTTDAISEAMTTKRNVDLFAACSDMPDPKVRWDGTFELTELLDRLESESGAQRREVKQRYEAVDALIENRRSELSEVAPAREMQQRAWELTRAADRGPDAVAIGYTSLLLLDAVEQLFEHDALRERLTRTVF